MRTASRSLATRYAHGLVVLAALGLLTWPTNASATNETPITITIDPTEQAGPTNPRLAGIGWNAGTLDGVAPLVPPTVRIDGSLHHASTSPDALDLTDLLARVAAVRAIGAEPQVILSYMPAWLGRVGPGDPRDPTRVAPSDFDVWQALVERVVETLASAPAPAHRFEVWNEPDLPVFWQDSPADFLELARRTHAAVAAAQSRTGIDLAVGGPATAFPDPAFIIPYAHATNPDYVSWHFYGNHPFFGSDGNEGFVPDALYQANARRNPFTTPQEFGAQVALVEGWVGDDVELVIDEWNVAAGGFDTRHDTHEGAAFDAAVLTEMERAGLDAADFYRAADTPGAPRGGEWGLVDGSNVRKPAWWVFDAWRQTAGARVAATGDDPGAGLWARATIGEGRIDVIVSSFAVESPEARDAALHVTSGSYACADVRTLATPDGSFVGGERRQVSDDRVTVTVPGPSVVWVRFLAACGADGGGGGNAHGLGSVSPDTPRPITPATGAASAGGVALVAVAASALLRSGRVRPP